MNATGLQRTENISTLAVLYRPQSKTATALLSVHDAVPKGFEQRTSAQVSTMVVHAGVQPLRNFQISSNFKLLPSQLHTVGVTLHSEVD